MLYVQGINQQLVHAKMRKGIILAGGKGTRLWPVTAAVSKHLLPIFDKPMIYYPLTTLMLAGIRDILIISMTRDIEDYKTLLGDGSQWGLRFSYAIQDEAKGIADAFIVGREFIGNSSVALILGDNVFYGHGFGHFVHEVGVSKTKATIFAYYVNDPKRYGVVEFDSSNKAVSLEEKPLNPKSSYAVPGFYFYDNSVIDIAANLKPSARGELEITDVNKIYMQNKELNVEIIKRGCAWFDAGTNESLLEASNFIKIVEERQGLKIGCPNEIAFRLGYINAEQLQAIAEKMSKGHSHHEYLKQVSKERS